MKYYLILIPIGILIILYVYIWIIGALLVHNIGIYIDTYI